MSYTQNDLSNTVPTYNTTEDLSNVFDPKAMTLEEFT